MITRRESLVAAAAAGLVASSAEAIRLAGSNVGQGSLVMPQLRAGARCNVDGRLVWWRGRFLGFLPQRAAPAAHCEIVMAAFDAEGMSDIRVRLI